MVVFLLPNRCLFQVEIYDNTGFLICFRIHLKIIIFKHVYVSSPLKQKMYKSEESPQRRLLVQINRICIKNERKKKIRFNYVQRAEGEAHSLFNLGHAHSEVTSKNGSS